METIESLGCVLSGCEEPKCEATPRSSGGEDTYLRRSEVEHRHLRGAYL